jgi:hypothetical protein
MVHFVMICIFCTESMCYIFMAGDGPSELLCPHAVCMCDSLVAGDCTADFVVVCVPMQFVCVIPLLLVTVLLILLWSVSPSSWYV